MKFFILQFLTFFLFASTILAQKSANYRVKEILISENETFLDSLSILPESLTLADTALNIIPDSTFIINYANATIKLKKYSKPIKIIVKYRCFELNFSQNYSLRDTILILPKNIRRNENKFENIKENKIQSLIDANNISKNGNITRGITVGNNQNAVMNSNLNLSLSGKISDNLNVMAFISENNLPQQNDGYTEQLQEFDKIFVKLYSDKTQLIFGDIDLNINQGYFMKVNRKVTGIYFSTQTKNFKTNFSASVAKGKYCRNTFTGQEGNQGPYRLRGADNELYVYVLAASEKVFIDGVLVKRGVDKDYVIDYQSGEIRFTANSPITKDKRIVVEFQYSDRNYARFLFSNTNIFQVKKSKFWLNAFLESDNKNQSLQTELSQTDKETLAQAGDKLNNAFVPAWTSTEYNSNLLLYKMKDTVVDASNYQVLEYSTNANEAKYTVKFTYMGEKNGNYRQKSSNALGRIYEWIAPVDGIKQGSYEPIRQLIPPTKKSLFTVGSEFSLTRGNSIFMEAGFSKNIANSFSTLDKYNDLGHSLQIQTKQFFNQNDSSRINISSILTFQYISKYFSSIDRFRQTEFERDWNLTNSNSPISQYYMNEETQISKKKNIKISQKLELMYFPDIYKASNNSISAEYKAKNFFSNLWISLLNSTDTINKTNFFRYQANTAFTRKYIIFGTKSEAELNKWYLTSTDSILPNSSAFLLYNIYINTKDTVKYKLSLDYNRRYDFSPLNNNLKQSSFADNLNCSTYLKFSETQYFNFSGILRKLTVTDTSKQLNSASNNLIFRLEYSLQAKNKLFQLSTYFENGTGNELLREFTFVEVPKGQGVYTWIDYNSNTIKELNEFEISAFADQANFVRVFYPSNNYIKVYINSFMINFNIEPGKIWCKKQGIKKILSHFSYLIYFKNELKSTKNKFQEIFLFDTEKEYITASSPILRNILYYNKSNTFISASYTHQINNTLQTLLSGSDWRKAQTNIINWRVRIKKKTELQNTTKLGTDKYISSFFSMKNYFLKYWEIELKLNQNIGKKANSEISFLTWEKTNEYGIEKASAMDWGLSYNKGFGSKTAFAIQFHYIKVKFENSTNNNLEYIILNGYKNGQNLSWSINWSTKLMKFIEMNLFYNGRKTGSTDYIVHTGGFQIRAIF